jgi:hypothetical protein
MRKEEVLYLLSDIRDFLEVLGEISEIRTGVL